MMKQKPSLTERLNIGNEVRELKLGCTFSAKNTTNAFHTIKYDFKPASVDKNRVATVDVGSNNQVTVTVPNLVNSNSGVPHTIYKGNQKKYTKECLLIYDKVTGDITLERLNNNIQVKKTRDVTNKPNISPLPPPNLLGNVGGSGGTVSTPASSTTITGPSSKFENSTMRVTSKTKVSTGSRRNKIIELKGGNSNAHNCSPARNNTNKIVEAAPAWNANNGQSTLPSIPMIVDDDDMFGLNSNNGNFRGSTASADATAGASVSGVSGFQKHINNNLRNSPNSLQQSSQQSSPTKSAQRIVDEGNKQAKRHKNQQQKQKQQNEIHYGQGQHHQQQQLLQTEQEQVLEWQRQLQQQQQQQQQHQQPQCNRSSNNNSSTYDKNSSQPIPISSVNWHNSTTNQSIHNKRASSTSNNSTPQDLALSPTLAIEAAAIEMNIVNDLSSSSSSSDSSSSSSDSSDTDSDSDNEQASNINNNNNGLLHQQQQQQQQQTLNQLPNLSLGILNSPPPSSITKPNPLENHLQHHPNPIHVNYASNGTFPNDLLQNDLQLSSNSSDEDDGCNGD